MRISKFTAIVAATTLSLVATSARAIPVIDGTAEAEYGTALSTQNTRTGFGDSTLGDSAFTNGGNELDQVFAKVVGDRLYVTIAGNYGNNFNKLEVYFDSVAGGVHKIEGANLPAGVDSFSGGALQRQEGLTFDAGFDADYYLTFTNGFENHNGREFFAMSAHYADLTQGTAGAVVSAGMQLAPKGEPRVLRFPFNSDFDSDSDADGHDFLTWQRNLGLATGATRATGDANGDAAVTGDDLGQWQGEFGIDRTFADLSYKPNAGVSTNALLGPVLPNLGQGKLIDKNYVAANGLVAPELDFATQNVRNMENTIDLEMAINNSNAAGVEGSGTSPWQTAGNPGSVVTGVEFSIPLSEIGASGDDIKITAFINGDGHHYASNQFSGTGILAGNVGGDGIGGFTGNLVGAVLDDTLHNPGGNVFAYFGEQFVTVANPNGAVAAGVVPEPATGALLAVAAVGLVATRRRRRA